MGEQEGGTNLETSIDRYTFPCVKQIASGDMLISTGNSAWCFDDLEGWDRGWQGDSRRRGRKKKKYIYIYTYMMV